MGQSINCYRGGIMLVQIKDDKGNVVKEFEAKEISEDMLRNYPLNYTMKEVK